MTGATLLDADAVLRAELHRRGHESVDTINTDDAIELAMQFAIWVPVAAYQRTPWLAPFAVRRLRHRTEINATGPKRDLWGLPTAEGHFSDDNSLIKGLALKRPLSTATPYGSAIGKGLVCCHIWSGTTGSPLLFSFIPNLVWLPRSLAPLSDAHQSGKPHPVHDVLKLASIDRYFSESTVVDARRVADAWSELPAPSYRSTHQIPQVEIADADAIVATVTTRLLRFIAFLAATLEPQSTPIERFSKRYHAGQGTRIDRGAMPVQTWLSEEARRQLLNDAQACLPPNAAD